SSLNLMVTQFKKTQEICFRFKVIAESYNKTVDEVDEEEGRVEPIIFQDFSDEEGSEEGGNDVMEIDEEENEELSKLLD
ncbi:hypothetical protein Tco_1296705, partial [Tanacetum coccineum]